MVVSLKKIIEKHYSISRGENSLNIGKKSQLAALILADIYESYETNKQKEPANELKFFLEINNPIKHIINILDNCGNTGTMSIDEAIINQYKIINNTKIGQKTLLSILETIFHLYPDMDDEKIRLLIIEELNDARLVGKLDEDGRNFLLSSDRMEMISSIIERNKKGDELLSIVLDIYNRDDIQSISTEFEKAISKMKESLLLEIEDQFSEIHNHLEHIGQSTFNQIESVKPIIDDITILSKTKRNKRHFKNHYHADD